MEVDTHVSGENVVDGKSYPRPMATHEEVIKDSAIFWHTLNRFHSDMGSKLTGPIIGGKQLNLHVLYIEVTRKGGYEQVVTNKKWREISNIFMFSPTTTSASYGLKKHYYTLLYHYEQAYFFGPRDLSSNSDIRSFEATGKIEGKFDCGYLVSVKVGSEILSGVLYHPGHPNFVESMEGHSCSAIVPITPLPKGLKTSTRGTRKKQEGGDPNRPKPNRSGYNFYFADKHRELKSLYSNKEHEFTKMIANMWNTLSLEEKAVYQDYAMEDKVRYQRELEAYKESVRINHS